ncbi:MAG TPA: hypothetical protein VMF30_18535, partial [Pirellulales bacterium]|nr:hypothetical protein [Pirellulales bacterium]
MAIALALTFAAFAAHGIEQPSSKAPLDAALGGDEVEDLLESQLGQFNEQVATIKNGQTTHLGLSY